MHILITTDTVGGVWTYTQELVTGLLSGGHRITVASFGRLPSPEQMSWVNSQAGLDYRPTEYRLEWMEVAPADIEESKQFLKMLVEEVQPDVLHLSQYCYGDLAIDKPKIVVAHSDVVSWWMSVHGKEPEESAWLRWYKSTVSNGLRGADAVVAPSRWMLQMLGQHYGQHAQSLVVHNARTAELFSAETRKDDIAVTVGRLWDEGKNVSLLLRQEFSFSDNVAIPIHVAGPCEGPQFRSDSLAEKLIHRPGIHFAGELSQAQIVELLARASVYIATSCYEPFGLAPLEAALSGCALLLNDIPSFHELWGDAALYFQHNDSADLAHKLRYLKENPDVREKYGRLAYQTARKKFSPQRMTAEYECLYQNVAFTEKVL